jgi:hypothetical protein
MTEGVPVIKIVDVIRKYGFYIRAENGETCLTQLEDHMKQFKKTKDKLQVMTSK